MLLQIIRTEWLKVKSYRTFWIMLSLFVVLVISINYIAILLMKFVKDKSGNLFDPVLYDYPTVWQSVAFLGSFVSLLLGLLIIILVCNEYTFKTHRQNVIDGWSRQQFMVSKLFWVVALSVFAMIICVITGIIFAAVYGTHGFSLENFSYVGYFFLQCLMSLTIAMLIAVLVRRAGLGIVLYLAYVMLENILQVVINKNLGNWGRLLPLESADRLLGFPFVEKLLPDDAAYPVGIYLLMLVIYIVGANFFVGRRLLKMDL